MAFCRNCGNKLDDGARFCANCGAPTDQAATNQSQGVLTIKWEGTWMLLDSTIHLTANGSIIGKYSFKKGFEVSIPITSSSMMIGVKYSIRNQNPMFYVNPSENYNLIFIYNRIIGNFDFMLFDQSGKRIQ